MFSNPGNTYALKWTPEAVKDILGRIEQDIQTENIYFIGEAMARQKLSRRHWSYWKKKFAADEDIMEQMALIEGIFESNLFVGGLHGQLNTSVVIFALKNNHRWTDRPLTETVKEEPYHEGAIIELSGNEIIRIPAFKTGREDLGG